MQKALSADQRDRKRFKTGLHTETGYPVQIPNINIFK